MQHSITAKGPKGEATVTFTQEEWTDPSMKPLLLKAWEMVRRQAGISDLQPTCMSKIGKAPA